MKRFQLVLILLLLTGCLKNNENGETESSILKERTGLETNAHRITGIDKSNKFDKEEYLKSPKELETFFKRIKNQIKSTKTTENEFYGDFNCTRNIPESLIKPKHLLFHYFVLNDSLQIGEELAVLSNRDSLYLVNKGCEYYWVEYWYSTLNPYYTKDHYLDSLFLGVLNKINKVDESPIDFKEWMDFITHEIDSGRHVKLSHEYYLDNSAISRNFEISNITQHLDRVIIQFSYRIGPL
ncbi:hypothetical protein [Flexithrix dorotheae]|uniref:hypothetical protein n=1 Tax=Flexithrix dorotheae TaxID=70993 RepID=UPI0003693998|nr:hypothetical protein [Flexithrix dorotheae]